jgi:hypothetical protein
LSVSYNQPLNNQGTAQETQEFDLTRIGEKIGGVSFADFTQFLLFSDTYQVTLATADCTAGQCGPTGSTVDTTIGGGGGSGTGSGAGSGTGGGDESSAVSNYFSVALAALIALLA